MIYLKEFKEMKKGTYIDSKLFDYLEPSLKLELTQEANEYYDKLRKADIETEELLRCMSILSCIKKSLEMTVRINVLTDARDKTRKYLQARGAVPISKGIRIWTSYYLGAESIHKDFRTNMSIQTRARSEVIRRVLKSLKESI